MLTEEEEKFVQYWEQNRLRKKSVWTQLAVGLPLGVGLVLAIGINFLSGWYKRADMQIRADSSVVMVLLVAVVLIVVFITVFSARHRWDLYETRYRELLSRRENK